MISTTEPHELSFARPDWRLCAQVTRQHGRTFYFASAFLPPARRKAMLAAYAFCRIADDIVDRAPATGLAAAAEHLDAWERELDVPTHPVALAFAETRARYDVPGDPVRDLIAGVRMDMQPSRYATWEELHTYCYHVAGTIGLITAPILGCRKSEALSHAVDLGIAMQLTNILRDVAEDARMDRVYLPDDDLARFGVCRETLLLGRPSGDFAGLMAFEIERARALYISAHEAISCLIPAAQMAILASSHLYAKILTRIEDQGYDVFAGRAIVPTSHKVGAVPTIAASFVRLQLPAGLR